MSRAGCIARAPTTGWSLLGLFLALMVPACGETEGAVAPEADASSIIVAIVDIPQEDAGVIAMGDAEDALPNGLPDVAEDERVGAWDSVAVATDIDDDSLSAPLFCSTWNAIDSGAGPQVCRDFTDTLSATDFTSEAGTWTVVGGAYKASGPPEQLTCPGGADGGSGMTASLLAGYSAADVRIHAKLTSLAAPDKVLVLRSRAGGNRIELNFVANYIYENEERGGALNISELVNCVNTTHVESNVGDTDAGNKKVGIPHAIGQAIVVDVQLIGAQLTVMVDGKQVFDDALPVSTVGGKVGFAVFRDAETEFDDFLVEVLK